MEETVYFVTYREAVSHYNSPRLQRGPFDKKAEAVTAAAEELAEDCKDVVIHTYTRTKTQPVKIAVGE